MKTLTTWKVLLVAPSVGAKSLSWKSVTGGNLNKKDTGNLLIAICSLCVCTSWQMGWSRTIYKHRTVQWQHCSSLKPLSNQYFLPRCSKSTHEGIPQGGNLFEGTEIYPLYFHFIFFLDLQQFVNISIHIRRQVESFLNGLLVNVSNHRGGDRFEKKKIYIFILKGGNWAQRDYCTKGVIVLFMLSDWL